MDLLRDGFILFCDPSATGGRRILWAIPLWLFITSFTGNLREEATRAGGMLIFPTGSMRLNAGAAAAAATTTTAVLLLFAPSNCPRCLLLLFLLFKPLHDNNKDTTERNDDQFFYLFIFFKSLKIQNSNPVFGSDWIPAPHRCRLICIREFTGRLLMAVTCIDYWWQQIRFDRDVILLCLPELGTNRTVWRAWKFPRNENGTYFSCIYFFLWLELVAVHKIQPPL